MVTIGNRENRAGLQPSSRSRWATLRASASTFSGNTRGNWCLRIIISTSTPKSSGSPSTSITRPIGGRVGVGQLVISTSTTSLQIVVCTCCAGRCFIAKHAMRRGTPTSAQVGNSLPGGIRMCCVMRSSKGNPHVNAPAADPTARNETCQPRLDCAAPARAQCGPCVRPSAFGGSTSTSTWSPCMAPLISFGGIKISSCSEPAAHSAAQTRSRRDADRAAPRPGCRVCHPHRKPPRNAPMLAVQLHQRAARRQPRQLLQQQTPLHAAAQAQLAHQLLVSGLLAG
jgi:hypothetical protein